MDRAVDHPPATFPPYDVYPADPARVPASGSLPSPIKASREKGEILLEVFTDGIVGALAEEFGLMASNAEGACDSVASA